MMHGTLLDSCIQTLENMVVNTDREIFKWSHREELSKKLVSEPSIAQAISQGAEQFSTIIQSVESLESWSDPEYEWRWHVVLGRLESSFAEQESDSAGDEQEEDEEQVAEQTESEGGAAAEGTEDDEISAQKLQKYLDALKDEFSYTNTLLLRMTGLVETNRVAGDVYRTSIQAKITFLFTWNQTKEKIKSMSQHIGLSGVLIVLKELMKKYRTIDVTVRILGTIITIPLLILVTFILPLYALYKNPEKIFKGIADALGIEIPEDIVPTE